MENAREKIFHLYRNSVIFSLGLLLVVYFFRSGWLLSFNLYYLNKAFAWTAFFLISLSMGLTSVAFFIKNWQRLIIYRKYVGVVGFWYFVSHAAISLFLFSDRFPFPKYFFSQEMIWSTITSILAGLILIVMILASRGFMIQRLGTTVWRRILRLGYLVMILVIIHFSFKIGFFSSIWLVAVIFSVIIFLARAILEIKIRRKNKVQSQNYEQNSQPTGTNL